MVKTPLKVVTDADRPVDPEPKTIRAAVDVSERALLVSLRGKIATEIDKGVPPHTLASLSKQIRDLDKEIRLMDAAEEGDDVGRAVSTPDEEWAAN